MVDEQEQKKIIKSKMSSIIRDKKQVKVGIPKEIVEYLKIDPNIDNILWAIVANSKQEISLEGHLIKGGKSENENIES